MRWSALLLSVVVVLGYGNGAWAAIFTVANTNPAGTGSLRQAILDANSNAGADRIEFSIPGSGPHTITPTNTLPQISDPVVIDARTQAGYTGLPRIVLSGELAGSGAHGLILLAGHCEVQGLAVRRFRRDGIHIEGGGTNVIQANHLGTDATGTVAGGNGEAGITLYQSSGNRVGGTNTAARNLVSGGNGTGVYIYGSGSVGNCVEGNYVGTDVTGTSALSNQNNGLLLNAAAGNQIGGVGNAANLISGNGQSGIYLLGVYTRDNRIQGNRIGTRADGRAALPNGLDGITVNGAGANQIGGVLAGEGNLIAGNAVSGIYIGGLGGRSNVVAGNFIGTGIAGTNAVPNKTHGVEIGSPFNGVGTANLISGNQQHGVYLSGTNAQGNSVQGNFIGCEVGGSKALPNGACGVMVNHAPSNRIGGLTVEARNVISGNLQTGVYLGGNNAVGNRVEGNFIGTDWRGLAKLPNQNGVGMTDAGFNCIGGGLPPSRNVLSGNSASGVFLMGTGAVSNRVQGNFIGTDATGMLALGNSKQGVYISAAGNLIGGSEPGAGNVVSANANAGISVGDAVSVGNVILGNFIGTKADGFSALGNLWHGIEVMDNASATQIGSTDRGGANHIACAQTAGYDGIRVRDGCVGNRVVGNAVFNNAELGIDLGPGGPNANDPLDADGGANLGQNYPVLLSAGGRYRTILQGSLNSVSARDYRLDFYVSPQKDATGYGEGQRWIGTVPVHTDAQGNAAFTVSFTNALPVTGWISSTATDAAGNTSEFSLCISNNAPASPDTDGDGLPDDYELAWGFNRLDRNDGITDADGDGASNVQEAQAGTSPRDRSDVLALSLWPEWGTGKRWLRFPTVPGRFYRLEAAALLPGPWSPLTADLTGTGQELWFGDEIAPDTSGRFYRLLCQP